jgi:hypothetical protein
LDGSQGHVATSLNGEQPASSLDGVLERVKNRSGLCQARDKLEIQKRYSILQKQQR